MRLKFMALPALVLVAACSGGDNQSVATGQKDPVVTKAAESPFCPGASTFYSPLPDDTIRFKFPFHLARDRIYKVDNGAVRRGLMLEYLDGSPEQIWMQVRESLAVAGYNTAADASAGNKGAAFSKKGKPSLFANVSQGPVASPSNPEAKGTIWISWQLPPPKASGSPEGK